MLRKTFIACLVTILFAACHSPEDAGTDRKQYEADINAWHAKRIESLKAPNGWLNLIGLFWLKPGANTFGSAEKNSIRFPEGKIAAEAGTILLSGDSVVLKANPSAGITCDTQPATDLTIFSNGKSKELKAGTLRFTIIKRDQQFGIRLRDDESEMRKAFTGVDRFPIDLKYRVIARFEKADSLKTIPITNIVGQTTQQPSPGTLVFELDGRNLRLDAMQEGDELFIVFGDATSAAETYAGGRFLHTDKPKDNETVILDFNKAYNPPCVFTPYATCPLPPKQNRLPVAIKAGEKDFAHH